MKRLALYFLAILMSFCVLPDLVSAQQQGLPVDGKDFYIGYVFPSFDRNPPSSAGRNVAGFFNVLVLITSYEDGNVVKLSYFDAGGKEVTSISKLLAAKQAFVQALDKSAMQMTDPGDIPEFKACHITSKKPVNVQYFSTGACSGGSYLAIPTPALGKKYVVPSYNDNPGLGAATNSGSQGEMAGGFFQIIAAFDNTAVQITPNGRTAGGHIGVNSGAGSNGTERPYSITLQRGQCYFVKGDGTDGDNDVSGSIIVASKPIAVLAGHEDAFIGDVGTRYLEARDFMIEEVIPAEYWDNKGYVSIPLKDTQPQDPSESGYGENYRVYTDDPRGAKIEHVNSNGIFDMWSGRFASPIPEKDNVGTPVDFYSTDGHNFGVMLYDNRSQGSQSPYPAESMMSIVPMSRWRTSFLFCVPANTFEVLQNYFINVIALKNDLDKHWIKYSFNGGALQALSTLSSKGAYNGLPDHPELKGQTFSVSPGTYYLTNTRDAFKHPDSTNDVTLGVDTSILRGAFMVYHYGMRAIDPDRDLGDFCGDDNFFSYALPIGMTVSSPGGNPTAKVDTFCSSWHVCVHDTVGITGVTLLDDPDGNFIRPGKKYYNVHFDPALDPDDKKEIDFDGNDTVVCFDVFVSNPLDTAYGPLFIIDSKGKHIEPVPELKYKAPHVFLANEQTPSIKIDTLIYPVVKVGQEICSTLVYINTAPKTGKPFQVNEAKLKKNDGHFKITSTVPSIPTTLKGGDTLKIQVCFNPNDTLNFDDTVLLKTDCFEAPLPIIGGGATPLIYATDIDFGDVVVGGKACKELTVSNFGKLDFILTKNWLLHNTNVFDMDPVYAGFLPFTLKPGASIKLIFCYSPKTLNPDSTTVDWNTNIDKPFTDQIKSWSYLKGNPIKPGVRWDRPTQHDSVICDDEVIVRVKLLNSSTASAHVLNVFLEGADAAEYRIVGNQLHGGVGPFGDFIMNVRDTIWVDVAFKADLSKVGPAKYASRQANLVASYENPDTHINDSVKIIFTGDVRHSNLTFNPPTYSFGFVTKGVPVTGFVTVINDGNAPFVIGTGGVNGVAFPNPPITGISMKGKALQTGDTIAQGDTITLTIDAQLDVYTDTTIDYTLYSSEPCGDFPAKIQIASSSLLVTGTGFPAPETFVTCRHADGTIVGTNKGSFKTTLESVEIIGAVPAGQFDLKDAAGALTQKVIVGKLLDRNETVTIPIVYHPTVSGAASATIQYNWDSAGKKFSTTSPATGTGAQLRTTFSAVQASGQPYTGETSTAFDVPVSLTTAALTDAAGVKRATFTFTYKRDVVNFQAATPAAGYKINNTPTPIPDGFGNESIFFDISNTTGGPIDKLESVVSLNYQVMVAKDMISPLIISDVKFYDGIDPTPICYVAADTIPGVFIPKYLCGDTTLHNFLSDKMPTRIAKLSPSVVDEHQDPILFYSINRSDVPVKVEIYNVLGQHVRTIKNTMGQPVGDYKLPIGIRGLQSGTYTVRLTTPTNSQTANFILQK